MATVVVLGGSFGGLTTAYELRNHLLEAGLGTRHQVVLVSDRETFTYRPALPWLVFGQRSPAGISFDLGRACRKRGISFIHGHVTDVDPGKKCVSFGASNLFYDHLVLAPGARKLPAKVPGLAEHSYSALWIDEAMNVRQALRRFRGGPAVIGLAAPVPWPCPAYEILWFLVDRLERRGRLKDATIQFVTPEPSFMFYAGPEKSRALTKLAGRRGVKVFANVGVERVEAGTVVLSDGLRLPSDFTLIFPHMGPPAVVESSRRLEKSAEGFVEATAEMRVKRRDRRDGLWVVGDAVGFAGLKSGRTAELQGRVAAWNIARELGALKARPRRYISEYLCIVRHGPGQASFVWERPGPQQGRPKRVEASALGRWPYFVKVGLEKTWLARHN